MRAGIRAADSADAKSLVLVLDAEQALSDALRLEIEEEAGYVPLSRIRIRNAMMRSCGPPSRSLHACWAAASFW